MNIMYNMVFILPIPRFGKISQKQDNFTDSNKINRMSNKISFRKQIEHYNTRVFESVYSMYLQSINKSIWLILV